MKTELLAKLELAVEAGCVNEFLSGLDFESRVQLAWDECVASSGDYDFSTECEWVCIEGAEPDYGLDDDVDYKSGMPAGYAAWRARCDAEFEVGEDYEFLVESQEDRNCRLAELEAERDSENPFEAELEAAEEEWAARRAADLACAAEYDEFDLSDYLDDDDLAGCRRMGVVF